MAEREKPELEGAGERSSPDRSPVGGDCGPATERGWRRRVYDIVFHHRTPAERTFDLILIATIVASIGVAVIDSVPRIHQRFGSWLYVAEWAFTAAFTVEYALRLAVLRRPMQYAKSFYGLVDLAAILPTWLSILVPGAQSLLVIRVLRILRIFRVLKLVRYVDEAGILVGALARSRRKILVFVAGVLTLVVIFGALMFVVEGPEHGFDSIPRGMYWAIVTVSTVGYGDVAPETALGRMIASLLMLIGYGIIAVPTGIYTAELAQGLRDRHDARRCSSCQLIGHAREALYCRRCAAELPVAPEA